MAAEAFGLTEQVIKDGTQVGDEAIVSDDQFLELSAGADVLIVEHEG